MAIVCHFDRRIRLSFSKTSHHRICLAVFTQIQTHAQCVHTGKFAIRLNQHTHTHTLNFHFDFSDISTLYHTSLVLCLFVQRHHSFVVVIRFGSQSTTSDSSSISCSMCIANETEKLCASEHRQIENKYIHFVHFVDLMSKMSIEWNVASKQTTTTTIYVLCIFHILNPCAIRFFFHFDCHFFFVFFFFETQFSVARTRLMWRVCVNVGAHRFVYRFGVDSNPIIVSTKQRSENQK